MMAENKPPKASGLLRSSAVVAVMTLLSRVLGLARDIVIAAMVGATANADAFFVAFKIPNFLRRLFAEGAFSQAFVPVLAEYREKGSLATVQHLVDRVAGVLGGVLLLVTTLAVIGAPVVATIFAPGFYNDAAKFALTADMIRITFPYLFLISMTGFAGAILNSYGRFAIPAFTPVLLNVCLIGAALWISPLMTEPAVGLAWGVLLAGFCQLVFQLPFLKRIHLLPRPRWHWRDEGVQKIIGLMIPALFGVSVSQINLLLDTVIASFLPTGSVSWLYYSDRLVELPLGVFAIAIGTVILPSLSRHNIGSDEKSFSATLDWAMRAVLILGVPAAVALFILAEPVLITLFQYGELSMRDVAMATFSLRAYTLGLLAFMLIKVLAPGYFAQQDTKTPVKIGVVAMAANMVLNLLFAIPLHHYFQLGHVGLALATAGSASLNAGLLFAGLRRSGTYQPRPGWLAYSLRLGCATAAMAAVLVLLLARVPAWDALTALARAYEMALLCFAGLLAYIVTLGALGVRLRHFRGQTTKL
ncbi:murein biosynthesis integral membrane protein MurJ [Litorivivens sp.]|uniref:murein biosynthesis integral membrane protein MurJ n=2 Tax=Litorivivens sp. TaxID=2020868 RepID=UPI003569B8EC